MDEMHWTALPTLDMVFMRLGGHIVPLPNMWGVEISYWPNVRTTGML